MNTTQRLAIRASEIRGRLAALAGEDELTDDTRSELEKLRNEYTDVETRSQAAILSESIDPPIETRHREEGDPEGREMRTLIGKCNVGKIFDSALEHRSDRRAGAGASRVSQAQAKIRFPSLSWKRGLFPRPRRKSGRISNRSSPT